MRDKAVTATNGLYGECSLFASRNPCGMRSEPLALSAGGAFGSVASFALALRSVRRHSATMFCSIAANFCEAFVAKLSLVLK